MNDATHAGAVYVQTNDAAENEVLAFGRESDGSLESIGVYSTVSYAVSRRTQEFGIRIALGAQAANVMGQVLGEGLRTVMVGIIAGLGLSLAAGKLVSSLLYGVRPSDPAAMAIVAAVLVTIALVAAFIPARRAAAADPVSALRAD